MKAVINSASKQTLPRFNKDTNQDELAVMVVVEVDFVREDGGLAGSQSYAVLPEQLGEDPLAYFQAQADALQADEDQAKAAKPVEEQSKAADAAITKLMSNSNE